MPSSLQERKWMFSLANSNSLVAIAVLAAGNLMGSAWLVNATSHNLISFHHVAVAMLAFAVFFAVVPMLRLSTLLLVNAGIDGRNAQREELAAKILTPDAETQKRLTDASCFAQVLIDIEVPNIVYSTEKDLLEQAFQQAGTIYDTEYAGPRT